MKNSANTQQNLPPFNPQTVGSLIQRDQQACDELLKLFEEEQQLLKDREVDALEALIVKKAENLKILENGAQLRTLWIKNQCQDSDKPLDQLWEAAITDLQPGLLDRWKTLKQSFKTAQEKNEVSGKVLARKNEAYSRILSILRGQGQANNLYTARGSKGGGGASQSLGEA